jgi:protoheme IX farnesyltransferase
MPPTELADAAAPDVAKRRAEGVSAAFVRDLVALAKPRITLMCVITTAGGFWMAERAQGESDGVVVSHLTATMAIVGTALIVAGANALNMYIERDSDKHMPRTAKRPLPTGRMAPRIALWFGVGLSVLAVPVLAYFVNPLTALLAVLANLSYVLAYTPMKARSHHALLVGAVPGAIPPLLGWTAATGRIDAGGMVLFAILFIWQIPHFHAITLFRREEYARAGLFVMPNVTGPEPVKHSIVRWTMALVAATLLLVPLGIAHHGYFVIASVLGAIFFGIGCVGLQRLDPADLVRWSRRLFATSIVYLVALFIAISWDPLF